jgi:hypothetical protein
MKGLRNSGFTSTSMVSNSPVSFELFDNSELPLFFSLQIETIITAFPAPLVFCFSSPVAKDSLARAVFRAIEARPH